MRERFLREVTTPFTLNSYTGTSLEYATRKYEVSLPSSIKWGLNGRFERGVALAKNKAVSKYTDPEQPDKQRLYRVRSSQPFVPPGSYLVDLDEEYCECPDHAKGYFCKHLIASHIIEIEAEAIQEAKLELGVPEESKPPVQQNDPIIWAVMRHNGNTLGVEVLRFEGDAAVVRALPKIIDGKKLQPQFPFEGKHCTTTVPKKELFHAKIFQ